MAQGFFANPDNGCIFAHAYKSEVSKKALQNVLLSKFGKISNQEDEHYAFAWLCMLFYWHTVRREICSIKAVPDKVFADTSIITDMSAKVSCLSFFIINPYLIGDLKEKKLRPTRIRGPTK